jgi:hypothetical protein
MGRTSEPTFVAPTGSLRMDSLPVIDCEVGLIRRPPLKARMGPSGSVKRVDRKEGVADTNRRTDPPLATMPAEPTSRNATAPDSIHAADRRSRRRDRVVQAEAYRATRFFIPARAADSYATAPSDCSGTEPVMAAFVALLPSSIVVHAASTSSAYSEANISLIDDVNKYNLDKIVDIFGLNKQKLASSLILRLRSPTPSSSRGPALPRT